MSKIKSMFGTYAEKLQIMVDNALDLFAPTWFQNYFTWGTPQTAITFTSVIGKSRIEAAASIIARGSASPLRSRAELEKLTGQIPAISEKFALSEEDYRNFLTIQNMNVSDTVKKQQLLDMMFGDVAKVGNAAMKRIDIMCLEGVSTGQISLSITNNPDGVVLQNPVNLLMPSANKINATVSWDSTSATPLTDILNVVNAGQAKGIKFAKILMTRSRWLKLIKTTEVKEMLGTWLNLKNVAKVLPTMSNVNAFLEENLYPPITIVDESVGIEKNGVISTIRPFKDENVVFIPAGTLGTIHHALAIEELKPVEQVNYAKFNNALISKWSENEPFQEFTKVELNAFPAIEAIDSIFLLLSTTVSSS